MKIAVLTDVHANLPALEAAFKRIAVEGCDAIFHTGDAVGIGPFPAETLDFLMSKPNFRLLRGNHDDYFVSGYSEARAPGLEQNEYEHHTWTSSCLTDNHRAYMAGWSFVASEEFEGVRTCFLHYPREVRSARFLALKSQPGITALRELFAAYQESVIFFGHDHGFTDAADERAARRFINPGSLGCTSEPHAHFCIVRFQRGSYHVRHCAVVYKDAALRAGFLEKQPPHRQFIDRAFFGGRLRL